LALMERNGRDRRTLFTISRHGQVLFTMMERHS